MLPAAGTAVPPEQDALTVISPGQKFTVQVRFHNGSDHEVRLSDVSFDGINHWNTDQRKNIAPIPPGKDYTTRFDLRLPEGFPPTRPYWHRDNPEEDAINTIDEPQYATLPFPPAPFKVKASYSAADRKAAKGAEPEISASVIVPFLDDKGKDQEQKRVLAVAPAFSVMLDPGEQVIPVQNGSATNVRVAVSSNLTGAPQGTLRLEVPTGWRVDPAEREVALQHRGESRDYQFKVFPASLKEGRAQIRAVLDAGNKKYSEGYSVVTREDLNSFYYYQPALQRVSIVDVKVPKDLKVGYIMGAGDDIPTVLSQLGLDVTLIPAEKLATEDLSQFGTIVLGIRAYDTQNEVAANNKRLLDYVANGGTLLVQYNASTGDFNSGHFTPYPAQLSRARVSVEEAPVEILAPEDKLLRYPNQITPHDFDGWVQERGLYFMDQWDEHFKPLLACNDPGEQAQKGGLLVA